MKKVAVEQLKENTILAREILTSGGIVLIPKGTNLKKQYVERLKDLGITYVYIEEAAISEHERNEEERIKEQCQETVRETLEKFSYLGNVELASIRDVAEEIITDILKEPEVLYSVSGIRNKTELIYSHSVNVCALSVLISMKMKLPKTKVRQVAIGSLLHDIGYSYIPGDLIYNLPEALSESERAELKKHVLYGYEATKQEKWLSATAKNIILYHHEELDGNGFPFHLSGDKIKIESRIVAVCDAFDRLVYGVFCEPMKVHEALQQLMKYSETKLDFEVLKVFLESVAAYPNGTKVVTSKGEIGVVVRQNPKCPTRPVLRMEDGTLVDLTQELKIMIRDTM